MSLLDPKSSRLDYGAQLMPPDGYKTSFAIGTTYSLNLETMLQVPLALFHSKYLSEATDISNLRADMLDALQQVREKVFLFVHADNIRVSTKYNILYNFLDQSIYNVRMDNPDSNFHPKMWLIRYEKEKDYRYRLIVMSRNLAPSADFDAAASFDSFPSGEVGSSNDNLVSFCDFLMRKTKNRSVMRTIRKELSAVRFDVPWPFEYKNLEFLPHTMRSKKMLCPFSSIGQGGWTDSLVISPFLNDRALRMIRKKTNGNCWLASRKEELDKIDRDILKGFNSVYQFVSSDGMEDGYDDPSVEMRERLNVNLHAKIYIVKAQLHGEHQENYHWYIGSTNCTEAAFDKNIEALVHLKSLKRNKATVSPQTVIEYLSDPKTGLFEMYNIESKQVVDSEAESLKRQMRSLRWLISSLKMTGVVENHGNNKYQITASIKDKEKLAVIRKDYSGVKIRIMLFGTGKETWDIMSEDEHTFTDELSCQTISPLLNVSLEKGDIKDSYLLLMQMEIPKERESKMMAEILDSEDKIMRYLMYLLDDNTDSDEINLNRHTAKATNANGYDEALLNYRTPILEKMLLASSRNREALIRMKETIDKVRGMKDIHGKALLSKEFLSLWNNFNQFAK